MNDLYMFHIHKTKTADSERNRKYKPHLVKLLIVEKRKQECNNKTELKT